MRFEREVAGVEEANDSLGIVPLERLSTRRHEERVVLAPDRQERRLVRAEVFLEWRIQRHVALVVAEEVELHFISAGTRQIKIVQVLAIRRHHRLVGNAVGVLPSARLRSEEGAERLSVRLRRVFPVGPDWTPAFAETFLVGVAVLRDDGSDPLGVADGEPEACRRAVVKDVHCKPIEADDLGKAVDYASDVVERVTEFLSWRHIGLTEPGTARREDMKSVGEERDQVAEHMARAWEAVQQQ